MTNEKQRVIERRERDEGKMDNAFFSQHREQSMLGSALKAWSVLIRKRSYISDKAQIRMDPINPGELYTH